MKRMVVVSLAALMLAVTPLLGARTGDTSHRIPYHLSRNNHVMVRIKVNGKGPFSLVMDTGSARTYLSPAACREAGIDGEEGVSIKIARMEIEGGAELTNVEAIMGVHSAISLSNSLRAAGVPDEKIDGLLGYDVLSRYKIDVHFGRRQMTWSLQDYTPLPPPPRIADLVKGVIGFRDPKLYHRAYFGFEVAEAGGNVSISAVHEGSPAAAAGLQKGDVLSRFNNQPAGSIDELMKTANRVASEDEVTVTVVRGGKDIDFIVKTGKGL